jgi:hypothetical protein
METKYINHSGGCPGSDITWEKESNIFGIPTISYSFKGHIHEGKNPKVLNVLELEEGWQQVLLCEKEIKRPLYKIQHTPYVRCLLSRNWFQVKNSESIYAIGNFINSSNKIVDGGTGWAVQMAINNNKSIYLFEQNLDMWYEYNYFLNKFSPLLEIPKLTNNFAGIGTRKIKENGINAIKQILKNNFYE